MCVGEFFAYLYLFLLWLTMPILSLNCRLQVELVNVEKTGDGPLTLLCALCAF